MISKKEIDKILYLAYFNLQANKVQDFTPNDVSRWFSELSLPRPNTSRLRYNIRKSRKFIVGNTKDSYRLHANAMKELNKQLVSMFETHKIKAKHTSGHYVNPARIDALKSLKSNTFDFRKLVKLCEELNICYQYECYLSLVMLTRAIIDHVPPIFGCKSFSQISNNYNGSKSFKDSMFHLSGSLRKIADQHLHCQIRKNESLPTLTQADFSNDLDVLISEIVRISS